MGYHKLLLVPVGESNTHEDSDYAVLLAGPFKFSSWLEYTMLLKGLL